MVEKYGDVNSIKICYEVFGEGEPLILVHGFGDRKEHFRAQIGDLSRYFKVIVFDNRGAGKSERPKAPYTMDIYADDIKALLKYFQIQKTNILGHSLGGMIVQNFVLKYPTKVKKAILINTVPGITPPGVDPSEGIEIYRKNAINTLKTLKKDPLNGYLNNAKLNFSRPFWKQMVENPKKRFYGLWSVEDLIEEKTKFGPSEEDINNQAEALKTHNVYGQLSEINKDILIIAADKDKSCPKAISEKIHQLIQNSKFIVLENAAHQSILEYPHEINQYIIDFLMKN